VRGGCKISSRTTSLCSNIFLVLRHHGFYLFTFENRVPLMLYWASFVWHFSLPLMNSFNKTEAGIRLCFRMAYPFLSVIQNTKHSLNIFYDFLFYVFSAVLIKCFSHFVTVPLNLSLSTLFASFCLCTYLQFMLTRINFF